MLPLHHDPGRDTSCRGMRLIQAIASVLVTTSVRESGRPDSNRRSQAPRACGLARLSHALIVPASSPCGNRTHLSALKGRYPRPIDERANSPEWAGGRSNPRLPGFNRPLDRLSYRPVPRPQRKGPVSCVTPGPRLREGCPWPGVTSARDRARAGSPTDRRIASLLYNPGCDADSGRTWTTSVRSMSQADSTRGRPCGPAAVVVPLQTRPPRGCSRDPDGLLRLARAGLDVCRVR